MWRTPDAHAVEKRLFDPDETLHAPHLIDRRSRTGGPRYAANGEIDGKRGGAALDDLAVFPMRRYPHEVLLPRVSQLRNNLTAYDAVSCGSARSTTPHTGPPSRRRFRSSRNRRAGVKTIAPKNVADRPSSDRDYRSVRGSASQRRRRESRVDLEAAHEINRRIERLVVPRIRRNVGL